MGNRKSSSISREDDIEIKRIQDLEKIIIDFSKSGESKHLRFVTERVLLLTNKTYFNNFRRVPFPLVYRDVWDEEDNKSKVDPKDHPLWNQQMDIDSVYWELKMSSDLEGEMMNYKSCGSIGRIIKISEMFSMELYQSLIKSSPQSMKIVKTNLNNFFKQNSPLIDLINRCDGPQLMELVCQIIMDQGEITNNFVKLIIGDHNPLKIYSCSCPECCDLTYYSTLIKNTPTWFFKIGSNRVLCESVISNIECFHRSFSISRPKYEFSKMVPKHILIDLVQPISIPNYKIFDSKIHTMDRVLVKTYDEEKKSHKWEFKNSKDTKYTFISHIWELEDNPDPLLQTLCHSALKYDSIWLDYISLPQKIYSYSRSGQLKAIFDECLNNMYEIQSRAERTVIVVPQWGVSEYEHRLWCIAEKTFTGYSPMMELIHHYYLIYGMETALKKLRIWLTDVNDISAILKYFPKLRGGSKSYLLWDFIIIKILEVERKPNHIIESNDQTRNQPHRNKNKALNSTTLPKNTQSLKCDELNLPHMEHAGNTTKENQQKLNYTNLKKTLKVFEKPIPLRKIIFKGRMYKKNNISTSLSFDEIISTCKEKRISMEKISRLMMTKDLSYCYYYFTN